jgi:MFS family permease
MRRARIAITAVFALNGFMFASVYSRFPAVQDRTATSEGEIGLALLCGMLGLLSVQLVAGALVSRSGSRPVISTGAIVFALGLVPVALSEALLPLAASMFLIGIGGGLLDVSMNVHGLTVERRMGRPILSGLHAAFSFGALAGAATGGILAGTGVDLVTHLSTVAGLAVAVTLVTGRFLLPPSADAEPEAARFAVPTRALALIGLFAICVLISEGAVGDWAAIYLNEEVGTGEGTAAVGLAAFSLTMAIGRLLGDRLNQRFGAVTLARVGGTLGAAGIGTAVLADAAGVAIAGFALAGVGLSTLFPLALRAAADQGDGAGPAVAAVSAMGYVGFLAGPPTIGGLAELAGLRSAFVLVVVCCAVAALLASRVRAPATATAR